jgi:anti-sigma factor RsiW
MGPCNESEIRISAYVDGVLDGDAAERLESHLRECVACATCVERERRLQSALRGVTTLRAPDRLRAKVSAAVRAAAPTPARPGPRAPVRRFALAAGLVAALLGGYGLGTWQHRTTADDHIPATVLNAHIRSLQAAHLVDVRSSDRHQIKPWFDGRLDYSPPVPNLDSFGYELVGGRLDYVFGRPTAALVYGHGSHVINLFLWPHSDGVGPARTDSDRGYHWIHGTAGNVTFCAISDLNQAELDRFVTLVRAQLNASPAS